MVDMNIDERTAKAAWAQNTDVLTCAHCGAAYYAGQVPFQTRWMALCPTHDGNHWFSKCCSTCKALPGELWVTKCLSSRGDK